MTDTPEIPGEFTRVNLEAPKAQPAHPIAKAQAAMVRELARLVAPKLHADPHAEEFEDVADYLLRVARVVDVFLLEVGEEVRCSATRKVDMSAFTDQLYDAVNGNATGECDRCADQVREDRAEIESALRHRRNVNAMIDDIYRSFGMPRR